MKTHDQVRQSVNRAYARAVTDNQGCCGNGGANGGSGGPCCTTAELAGYAPELLAGIPSVRQILVSMHPRCTQGRASRRRCSLCPVVG